MLRCVETHIEVILLCSWCHIRVLRSIQWHLAVCTYILRSLCTSPTLFNCCRLQVSIYFPLENENVCILIWKCLSMYVPATVPAIVLDPSLFHILSMFVFVVIICSLSLIFLNLLKVSIWKVLEVYSQLVSKPIILPPSISWIVFSSDLFLEFHNLRRPVFVFIIMAFSIEGTSCNATLCCNNIVNQYWSHYRRSNRSGFWR